MTLQEVPVATSPVFSEFIGLETKVVIGDGGTECHGAWYVAVLVVSSALFLVYLGITARKNVRKLWNGRSHIMMSYYGLLCLAACLNLAWCSLQDSYTSGMENLARTFVVSGIIVGVDIFLEVLFPVFIDVVDSGERMKWGFWIIHELLLTGIYGYILFVHFSKWRERLPPRPALYKYIIVMFIVNAIALFAAGFAGLGAGLGIWLFNLTVLCYHSLYLPFLYATFLAEFFQEEDFLLDNAYYSEMKDAGFFDADWD